MHTHTHTHIYTTYTIYKNIFDGFSDESSTLILLLIPTSTRNT